MDFTGKTIAIGVCGGIAAYRVCDFIRELYRRGADRVMVMMTDHAQAFVTPLSLQALTRESVYTDPLSVNEEGTPIHIAMAQDADVLVIFSATANTLAKLAHGLADDLVSTTAITFTGKPVVIVPAMNTRMWEHPLTQQNVDTLNALENVLMVFPIPGDLACGETGDGHLADQDVLLLALYRCLHLHKELYRGIKAMVSAGGTREPVDPVRVLTNRSSGKMGIALADELYGMGAEVTLVTTVESYHGKPLIRPYPMVFVETADELRLAVEKRFSETDLLMMASAVSDFRPVRPADQKLKKNGAPVMLELQPSHDILAGLGRQKQPHQVMVGFAAESENLEENAMDKLTRKNLDTIVLNDISRPDIGFSVDANEVTLLFRTGEKVHLPKQAKAKIAQDVLLHLKDRSPSSVASEQPALA